jgi:hypothetical protein
MGVLALELNDAGLVSSAGEGWRDEGPGYALLDPDRLLLGAEARAQARLRPRRLVTRFWARLDTAPLLQATAYAGSHADLACAQLDAIWRRRPGGVNRLLPVVPGGLDRGVLELLLGIAAELGIPVCGLVDAAVAATLRRAPGRELAHLDFSLHGALLTRIAQGEALERAESVVLPEAGLLALEDAWARAAAGAFVAQTRFDPLHAAESEQALYDRLPGWLAALHELDEVPVELPLNGEPLAARLARAPLVAVAGHAYRALAAELERWRRPGAGLVLQLSHRALALPELARFLAEQPGIEILPLPPEAAVAGALARLDALPASSADGPRFVTRLPALGDLPPTARPGATGPGAPGSAAAAPEAQPTHLLHGAEALPIGPAGLAIGTAPPRDRPALPLPGTPAGVSRLHCIVRRDERGVVVEDLSRFGSFVNDERVEGRRVLAVGDRLRLGSPGVVLQLIRVQPDSA